MQWSIGWNFDCAVYLFAEYVRLPQLKGMLYGKEKEESLFLTREERSLPPNDIPVFAEEVIQFTESGVEETTF
ncbi:hypothetical protein TNCV_2440481 [Trichonephila clavipes]|nr:hypothetical protein TNCV_2440481 [Trichonephila clavipes]